MSCGECKYFAQGKTCSFCDNPKQTNDAYKTYSYYSFGLECKISEKGIHESRIEYMKSIKK